MFKRGFYYLLLVSSLFGFPASTTATETYDEYHLKAAITYNIAKFVKWPEEAFADAEAPLIIFVIGNRDTNSGFASLEGQLLGHRPILIRYAESPNDFQNAHILFIARSKRRQLDETLLKLQGNPILTISDIENFVTQGGMINLVQRGNNIRFAINLDVSMAVDLQVSSQLYSLATEVIRNGQ